MFKKFISYYRPYKFAFFFDLFCAAVISIIDIAYPQFLRSLGKTIFTQDKAAILSALPYLAGILLLAYIIQTLCKYYVSCQGHIMGAKMERDMRRELFDHYQKLSFSYYDQNNTGTLMSRMVSDLFDISEMAHHGPENLFISFIKAAGSFGILFFIQWRLALILLFFALTMAVFSVVQRKKMRATFSDNRKKIGEINGILQDSLSGIRIVQAFANEKIEARKFARGNEDFLTSKKENYRAMGNFNAGNCFFMGLMYAVSLVAGGFFIAQGQMTTGDLAMFALYIGIFASPVQVLIELTEQIQKGLSGFRRFVEIIDTPVEIVEKPGAKPLSNPRGQIEFENVSFFYEENENVLKDISFTINPGKSIALVGPSGGGKTTVCSLLPRFYDVTSGAVKIGGQDIRDLTLDSLRKAIGIVQQDIYLFGGTIRENIAYGNPEAGFEEIVEAAKKANIHDYIMTLPDGYDTFCGERGVRLSGGQKQRISIARVFLKNPPILILDEATSALDNESERLIQQSLDQLSKDRTTITIAHRLSTIKNADEILVIDKNSIQERGSHSQLLEKNGIYARYYRLAS